MLISLLFTVSAQTCPSDEEYLDLLQRAIIYYLTVPSQTDLSLEEMKDIIIFYLSTDDISGADCDFLGEHSSETINDILSKIRVIEGLINDPCLGGVLDSTCSYTKPLYCVDGTFVNRCEECGCDEGLDCINNDCFDCPRPSPVDGYPPPTTYYMGVALYSWNFTINGQPAEIDDEIAAFNQDEILVGRHKVDDVGIYGFLMVYGKDGDIISFRVIDKSAELEYIVDKTYTMSGVAMQFPSVEFDLGDVTC